MYLYLNVAAYLNDLWNLFPRKTLPLLARILKEKINQKKWQNSKPWLLYLSAKSGMDLERVFSFPILPEPACFAYPDGTIRQNDKSTVLHRLTKDFQSNLADTIETPIADGMFILNLSTWKLPKTYSALVRRILVKF